MSLIEVAHPNCVVKIMMKIDVIPFANFTVVSPVMKCILASKYLRRMPVYQKQLLSNRPKHAVGRLIDAKKP
jgi:hypothetical protein